MAKIAVTGHRFLPPYMEKKVKAFFRARIKEEDTLITGMALGVDQWAAEVAIEKRVLFTAAIPFIGQEDRWTGEQKDHYYNILEAAHEIEVVSDEPKGYQEAAIALKRRNIWMVDNCDKLLAVWNGQAKGGTYHCRSYALKRAKKPVITFNPLKLKP
jgi:uncharacterized phage-like protein YoqJ